ncbi:hypothetical protein B0H13DRAFT_1883922 [Mycena leptocephala]|nr:hypothetical protein B0H13DRAFT_1883922 [Mycena leptocephala]
MSEAVSERERKDTGRFKLLLQGRSNGGERVVTSRHKLAKNVEERAGECEKQTEDESWNEEERQSQADIVGSWKSGNLQTKIIPGVAPRNSVDQKIHSSIEMGLYST